MTVLISMLLIGGLYFGWHFDAYPVSYFLIGTGAITAFDILVVLPYQLYKANNAEITSLTERLRPKIEIIGLDDTSRNSDGSHQIYKLKIRNSGGEQLKDCLVKLDAITGLGGRRERPDIPTPLAMQTEWQAKGGRSGSFNMRVGESKIIPIFDRIAKQAFNFTDETGVVYSWPYANDVELHIGMYGAGEPTLASVRIISGEVELVGEGHKEDQKH